MSALFRAANLFISDSWMDNNFTEIMNEIKLLEMAKIMAFNKE